MLNIFVNGGLSRGTTTSKNHSLSGEDSGNLEKLPNYP